MNDKMKPAIIGGVALGLLSAIPLIGAVNACCCAWAVLGGLLAANMYVKSSPTPVRPADGAVVGAIAGVIGAVIYVVVGLPLGLMTGNATMSVMEGIVSQAGPEAAEAFRTQAAMMQNQSVGQRLMAAAPIALVGAVLLVIFSTIGGLIGVSVFEKRKGGGADVPPPPPNFGGPQGGGYAPPPSAPPSNFSGR